MIFLRGLLAKLYEWQILVGKRLRELCGFMITAERVEQTNLVIGESDDPSLLSGRDPSVHT
jgi:hypothetical protein